MALFKFVTLSVQIYFSNPYYLAANDIYGHKTLEWLDFN